MCRKTKQPSPAQIKSPASASDGFSLRHMEAVERGSLQYVITWSKFLFLLCLWSLMPPFLLYVYISIWPTLKCILLYSMYSETFFSVLFSYHWSPYVFRDVRAYLWMRWVILWVTPGALSISLYVGKLATVKVCLWAVLLCTVRVHGFCPGTPANLACGARTASFQICGLIYLTIFKSMLVVHC